MASLAVSVITVTVLLSVIAHGASAEPLAWRYGAAAGPGGNGDHGLPWAGLSTQLSFPEIAAEMFLSRTTIKSEALSIYRKLGASSRSQAVARSRELGLLRVSGPATSRTDPSRPRFPPASRGGLTSNPMSWSADSVGGQRASKRKQEGIVAGAVLILIADRLARRDMSRTG